MNIKLGNLNFLPAQEHRELMSPGVYGALLKTAEGGTAGVAEIDPNLSDTAAFCEFYKTGMNQAANCVVLRAERADKSWFAACVILGNTRADVNGLVRRTIDARRASFARMEEAVSATGMEYGAITPVGLPDGWPILVDKAVADSEYVIIGSGLRKSKLTVPGKFFASLPGVQILENLSKIKHE